MPVYNVEEYLRSCLESLMNQTLKEIEIICVDDCSTDNCREIIQKYAQKDNRIKLIKHTKNQGPGIARNSGIECAEGEHIMFLDPDDWLEPDACEVAYNQINKNKNDIVFFRHRVVNEKTKDTYLHDNNYKQFLTVLDKPNIKLYEDLQGFYIKFASVLFQIYKREFLNTNNIKFPDYPHAEDVPFYIKAIACADTVSVINKVLYNYRYREDSLTRTRIKAFEYIFKARELANEYIEKYAKGTLQEAYLIYYIKSILHWYSKQNYKNKKPYYIEMRKLFINLQEKHDIEAIKRWINYKKFKNVVNCRWSTYRYKEILNILIKNIFSITNSTNHKIITVLGVKFKIGRKAAN